MPSTQAQSLQLPRREQFNIGKKHDEVQTHFTSKRQTSFITEAGDLSSCQLAASLRAGGRWRSEAAAGRGPRLGWLHPAMHGSLPSPLHSTAAGLRSCHSQGQEGTQHGARSDCTELPSSPKASTALKRAAGCSTITAGPGRAVSTCPPPGPPALSSDTKHPWARPLSTGNQLLFTPQNSLGAQRNAYFACTYVKIRSCSL